MGSTESFLVVAVERNRSEDLEVVLVEHLWLDDILAEPDHSTSRDGSERRVLEMLHLEHDSNVRREVESFSVGKSEELVVVENTGKVRGKSEGTGQLKLEREEEKREKRREEKRDEPVQVLYPFWIHISVEDDPMPLRALSSDVVDNLPKDVSEETVVPFPRRLVERSVESVLVNRLGIDNVGDSLDSVQSFESGEEDLPGLSLSASRGSDHHQSVLNHVDLVELDDLVDPKLSHDEMSFGADLRDLLLESVEVDGDVVDSREDVGEETEEKEEVNREEGEVELGRKKTTRNETRRGD